MPTYKVIEPVKVGSEKHMPGDSVELAAKDGDALVAAGVLAAPAKVEKNDKAGK